MNKKELIQVAAGKAGMTERKMSIALNALTATISESLNKDEDVSLVGFGRFAVKQRGERMVMNPRTRAQIEIPAHKVVRFKASQTLLNKK